MTNKKDDKSTWAIGENLIMACMEISAGKEDIGHEHSFDQCSIVLKGRIEMFIGKDRKRLKPNETYFIPSGREHGWKTFEESTKISSLIILYDTYPIREAVGDVYA